MASGNTNLRRVSVVFDMVWNGAGKLKEIQTGIDSTVKKLTGIESATAKVATAWAGLFAARMVWQEVASGIQMVAQAVKRVVDITEQGAGIEQLERSFTRLNETVIKSPSLLDDMTRASQGTISEMKSMEGFMTLVAGQTESLTRQFAAATPELVQIAKAANVLNPSLGDTTFFFESLARGIKRAEVRLIDNLGLNLKVGDATKRLAAQLGKSVEALTAEERQVAILNETLRVGRLLIQQVGDDIDAVGDPIQRMRTDWQEAANSFKQETANQIIPSIRAIDEAWEGLTGNSGAASKAVGGGFGQAFGDAIDAILRPVELLVSMNMALGELGIILFNTVNQTGRESERGASALKRWVGEWERFLLVATNLENNKFVQLLFGEQISEFFDNIRGGTTDMGKWTMATSGYGEATSYVHLESQKAALSQRDLGNYVYFTAERYRQGREGIKKYEEGIKEHNEAAEKAKEREKELEDAIKDTTDAIEAQSKAITEARDRRREMAAAAGDLFTEQMNAERGAGLYKQAIEDIGTAWVRTGGRNEEQKELLEDLQTAYDKAGKEIRDYSVGIKGFGEDQDKVNEKVADAQARMQHYGEQISRLEAIQGSLQQVQVTAVWNQEAINDMLYSQADAAGASATQLALLKLATGELSDEQAIAALKAAAMATKIEEFGQHIADGMSPQRALQFIKDFQSELDQADFSVFIEPKIAPRNRVGGSVTGELLKDLPREEREYELELGVDKEDAEDDTRRFFDFIGGVTDMEYDAVVRAQIEGLEELNALQTQLEALEREYKVVVDVDAPPSIPSTPGGATGEASGTNYFGGGRTWVGESGPELVTLPRGTRIDGAHRTQQGGGTTIIVNNYNRKAEATSMALVKLRARGVW